MTEVTGKTLGELEDVQTIDKNSFFLVCQGTNQNYSTLKTTYQVLSNDLVQDIENVFNQKLDGIKDIIDAGDGELYVKKIHHNEQTISSNIKIKGLTNFDDSVIFKCGTERLQNSQYNVILPKDTFRNPDGNTFNANNEIAQNDDMRVAIKKDITQAINEFRQETAPICENIMDTSYDLYLNNGVAITPSYTNKNYLYNNSNTFYRFAGIKTKQNYNDPAYDENAKKDGIVFKQISTTKFTGIPLSKSYKNYQSLNIVYVTNVAVDSANENESFFIVNIPTTTIDIIKQYQDYKSQYKHKTSGVSYFDDRTDKFYIEGRNEADPVIYFDTKTSAIFTETFLPIKFRSNTYSVIAVFGHR